MDPFTKPHDETILDLARPENETQEEMIIRLIKQNATNIDVYKTGQLYYDNHPDIKDKETPKDHNDSIDPLKPDWRIGHSLHATLVDQKIGYIVGEPPSYKHNDESLTAVIDELLGFEFSDELNDLLTAASNKGIEWLHPYVNEDGEFKFLQIPAEQVIPIYRDRKERELEATIRHYKYYDEVRVEYWTADEVTYYTYTDGELTLAWYHGMDENNPTTHLDGESWGRVPYIPFKNNAQSVSDIWRYKEFLDAMNSRISDVQNMFDESTELIYVLKGYEGTDLGEFKQQLKYNKAISVDLEGGVDTISIDVPVESSIAYLEQMKQYVYAYGRGVDFNKNELGNSPSGIALKFLYTDLDLKSKQLARKTIPAIKSLIAFAFEYKDIDPLKAEEIDVTFNYNRIINELEQANIASMSADVISEDTVISNHPWVDSLEKEKERMLHDDERMNTELPIKGVEDDEL